MPGPLEGIKVLDITRFQNGPSATRQLADYGADVVKIEALDGEVRSSLTNPSLSNPLGDPHQSFIYNERRLSVDAGGDEPVKTCRNIFSSAPQPLLPPLSMYIRSKKSVTLDLRNPESKEIMKKLVQWADVLAGAFLFATDMHM